MFFYAKITNDENYYQLDLSNDNKLHYVKGEEHENV